MVPSDAPVDGSLPSSLRVLWPWWSRHMTQIEVKIDKSRQFHGDFDLKEIAVRELKRALNL